MAVSPDQSYATSYRWPRRMWGLDPRSVEGWADDVWGQHVRELATMLKELRELQGKLAASEASSRTAAARAAAAEGQLAQLRANQEERERRYQTMRDEALAAVAYAWVKTQQIEEHTKEQLEQAYAHWRDEEVRLQHHREREREDWQVVLSGLRSLQIQAIERAEGLAKDLLDYAGTLRTRVEEDPALGGSATPAIPPIDYYWQDTPPPQPVAAASAADGPLSDPVPFDPDLVARPIGDQSSEPDTVVRKGSDRTIDASPRPD